MLAIYISEGATPYVLAYPIVGYLHLAISSWFIQIGQLATCQPGDEDMTPTYDAIMRVILWPVHVIAYIGTGLVYLLSLAVKGHKDRWH